ncbi:Kinesin-like protein KIN-7O, partial [Linum grandiflorum]
GVSLCNEFDRKWSALTSQSEQGHSRRRTLNPAPGEFPETPSTSLTIAPSSSSIECLGEDSKIGEIYRARTRDIVAAAIRGFNATVDRRNGTETLKFLHLIWKKLLLPEEELEEERNEKKIITKRSEDLASELATISKRFNASSAELCSLQQEILGIRLKLEASTSDQQEMENSITLLLQEKEDLALQLGDSLLEMEEEKAIWFSKEKASLAVIERKRKLHNEEITTLYKALSEVQGELESCQEEYQVLKETLSKKEDELAEKCRSNVESDRHQETGKPDSEIPSGELDSNNDENVRLEGKNLATLKDMDAGQQLVKDLENLQSQLDIITKEKESMMEGYQRNAAEAECLNGAKTQIEELSGRIVSLEVKMLSDYNATVNEKTKLRMTVRGTQA